MATAIISGCANLQEPSPDSTSTTNEMAASTSTSGMAEPTPSADEIIVGVEYVLIDNPGMIQQQASLLGTVGFHAAKPIAEAFSWGTMQRSADDPIDFTKLDNYIIEFQQAGFAETVLALKSHSTWASVDHVPLKSMNAAPKPEFRDDYAAWVGAIVERYDGDGISDMEGLIYPIRHYEIGSEFSSYEPEPVDDYLEMLEIAYNTAHQAYEDVIVAHAAFLVLDFLIGDPDFETLDDDLNVDRYGPHRFSDIRAVLDHPELFDVLNIHALAHPGEIEQMVRWLDWETSQRGYEKPIIISDTSINPFISFGSAIVCDRPPNLMGLMVYPATEDDRCRLADYFNRVLDGDPATVGWLRAFAAADMVKKVVIGAEQNIALIDTAFTTDLPILDSRLGQAGAGNAGWGGMIEIATGTRYPSFYALGQLLSRIDGYDSVRRVATGGLEGTRVYEFVVDGQPMWVGWYDPPYLVLQDDPPVETKVTIQTGAADVIVEHMISDINQSEPVQQQVTTSDDTIEVSLDQTPTYVIVDQ